MYSIQHDPRTKQQMKDALYAHLYDPVNKALTRKLEAIATRNCVLQKVSHKSFAFKGEMYVIDPPPLPRIATRLAPELTTRMQDYLEEVGRVNVREMPYVMGFITQVLNSSNHFEDYLRVFPQSMHQPIHRFMQSCPCYSTRMSDAEVHGIQEKNELSINLIKQRMTTNLLY